MAGYVDPRFDPAHRAAERTYYTDYKVELLAALVVLRAKLVTLSREHLDERARIVSNERARGRQMTLIARAERAVAAAQARKQSAGLAKMLLFRANANLVGKRSLLRIRVVKVLVQDAKFMICKHEALVRSCDRLVALNAALS